jgi:hypothetical protein
MRMTRSGRAQRRACMETAALQCTSHASFSKAMTEACSARLERSAGFLRLAARCARIARRPQARSRAVV